LPHIVSIQPASVSAMAEFGLMRKERLNSSRARSRPVGAMFQTANAAIQRTCASSGASSTARKTSPTAAARPASSYCTQPWKWH
jgi:hypothetical protein